MNITLSSVTTAEAPERANAYGARVSSCAARITAGKSNGPCAARAPFFSEGGFGRSSRHSPSSSPSANTESRRASDSSRPPNTTSARCFTPPSSIGWGVTTATCSSRRPGEAEAGGGFDELRVDFDVDFFDDDAFFVARAPSFAFSSSPHASPTHAHPDRFPSNTARSSASAKSFPPSHTLYPPWKNARSSAGDAAAPAEASDAVPAPSSAARRQNTAPSGAPRPARTAVCRAESPPSASPPCSRMTSPLDARTRRAMSSVSAAGGPARKSKPPPADSTEAWRCFATPDASSAPARSAAAARSAASRASCRSRMSTCARASGTMRARRSSGSLARARAPPSRLGADDGAFVSAPCSHATAEPASAVEAIAASTARATARPVGRGRDIARGHLPLAGASAEQCDPLRGVPENNEMRLPRRQQAVSTFLVLCTTISQVKIMCD